jgi:hypothetical protein
MNRTTISAGSLAALILAAPIAFAQQPPENREDRAPSQRMDNSAGERQSNTDGGPERSEERREGRDGQDRGGRDAASDRRDAKPANDRRDSAGDARKDAKDDGKPSKRKASDDAMKSSGDKAERKNGNDGDRLKSGSKPSEDASDEAKDATGKTAPGDSADQERVRNQDKAKTPDQDRAGDDTHRKATSDQARGEVREEDRQKAEQVRSKIDVQVRDRVRETAFRGDVRRANRTDIRIDIGVRLPRTVEVYDLPPEIVAIAPAYRGYRYIVIGDDYCVVDPETYVIVDVIPRRGGGRNEYAYRSGGGGARIELTNDQIELIRRETRNRGKTYDFAGDLEVGIQLPGEYAFEPFPDTVVQEIPVVRNYRFVHVEDEIAIVAADEPDVVYVIGD